MSLFVSSAARRRLDRARPAPSGRLAIDGFREARELLRELELDGGAAALMALSLLEEVIRRILEERDRAGESLLGRTAEACAAGLGDDGLARLLAGFASEFGLGSVELPATGPDEARPDPPPAGNRLLLELLVFWWLSSNPALAPLTSTLHRGPFLRSDGFATVGRVFREVLGRLPGLDTGEGSLLDSLTAPFTAVPGSAVGQLRWLLARWRQRLGDLTPGVVAALDLAAEEEAERAAPGHAAVEVPSFAGAADARYSRDRHWMRRLVLVAKNCLVWLEQLSREHGRWIRRLDEIPDEALERLARRGFNGLWLIGVWERSPASRQIKRLCGNPEAEASAYSVREYRIAERLGGEQALEGLRERAAGFGIRLAADMVPNHTAIDSRWVLEHPDRFVGQPECPFPSYTFDGPDLSPEERACVQIEDHYFDRTDAAVVFRRTERATGEVRYLYHGNDGTSMPWNDTAQLDYLNSETRAAVIDEIVAVARRFPVIRFDAAMTLTRQHVQRLWYPRPGEGGAIPSRAEWSLPDERFDRLMPHEFWREVVDRVAAEAPDTLLLAEAFWLLEGYFVRNLGMHRVYNSAFMHMLRDEDNAGFRELVGEALTSDPAVLERFVNFMSNPDESPAIEQFGSGARYRGVCVLLATLPGLPMFAHGQVEGLGERYGMEYARPYREERPDEELVEWHESRLAPLLGRRELFSGAGRFELFDFVDGEGRVDEAVLAFSNAHGEKRALVVFNHRYGPARGTLARSVPRRAAAGAGGAATARATLAEALGLGAAGQAECRLRDLLTGLESSHDSRSLREIGLELELGPYECRVLVPAAAP